ncbi:MAG: transketolase family protein [Clostridia bacterium]|nr:transketolase family protein [Clostridia bacterium]
MGKSATRDAYGKALAEFGGDERIVVLDADLSKSTKTAVFKDAYPDRHFNMGIAEANMMGVAAGLAAAGKIVFASSFAVFATSRAYEQIRNSICYPKANVKVCASHAGITVGDDGASHQSIEDISIMRTLPNMTVLCPSDAQETRFCVKTAIETDGPFYIRLGRLSVEDVYEPGRQFEKGKGIVLRDFGDDVAVIAAGYMVQQSLKAADILLESGIKAKVIDMFSIKPIDKELIVRCAEKTGFVVTCEEHSIIGGLGSAVCEVLSEERPTRVLRIGMEDTFGKSGTPDALLELFGLNGAAIAEKIKRAMK